MRKLEEVTGRKYKPLKYWANFDPSDAKLVFDVSLTPDALPNGPDCGWLRVEVPAYSVWRTFCLLR